ncbi:MAG: LPS export ABC transporter periplasmic protein LptC [Chlorobiota bacterium]
MKYSFSILMIVFTLSCTEEAKVVKKEFESSVVENQPSQISYKFSVHFLDSNKKKAYLEAYRARIYDKEKITKLDSNVNVDFYSKDNGKKVSNLIADSVLIDDKTQDMTAMGNVVVVSDTNKTTIKTTLLKWNDETRKLTSDKYVKIVSPEQEIEGIGFESDEQLKNYTIYKVKGVKYK